jgi:glycine cleavage system transcriptional repressor
MAGAPDPGLCGSCREARVQVSARRSRFFRCGLADEDPRFRRYPALPVLACPGYAPAMRRWFILSAIGRDRPGLVAELASLVLESNANLEDSRMTILGSEFAVILLCSSSDAGAGDALAVGAKRLERDHGLTILLRHLEEGQRSAVPAPGTRLYRVEAAGEDRAGIVAGICRTLAERGVNIVELNSRSRPGPGGSPHYEMGLRVEVPDGLDPRALREALEAEADRLVIDVSLMRET